MGKKRLRKMFPDWASPEAVIKRLGKEYREGFSESDIYFNSSGDIIITQDMEHIAIFTDDERPGLYVVGRMRIFDFSTTYSDANSGLAGFMDTEERSVK